MQRIGSLLAVALVLATSLHSSPAPQGGVTPGGGRCTGTVEGYPRENVPGYGWEWDNPDLQCGRPCVAGCMSVSVPFGYNSEAYVCSCVTGSPNVCCTIGLRTDTFYVVAVGDCSAFACPDDTFCHLTAISNLDHPWTGEAKCDPDEN